MRSPYRFGVWSGAVASAVVLAAQAAAAQSTPAAAAEGEALPVIGHVQFEQKISQTSGGFVGTLNNADALGLAVAPIGDLDGDGTADLAVGAAGDDDGGSEDLGAVWILFLHPNGTVKSHQKISAVEGGFTGVLDDVDFFGRSVSSIGDLDGDRTADLAVSAIGDDDGGEDRGAVWILLLGPNGAVRLHTKISDTSGGFIGDLDDVDLFGFSVAALGDLDGDRNADLAVGAPGDDDGSSDRGAAWILYLDGNGCFVQTLFEDGFESGHTGAWSATVG